MDVDRDGRTILSLASRLLRRMLVQSARSTGGSGAIPFSSRQEHQSPAGIQIRPARRRRPRIRPPRATSRQSSSEAEASRLRSLSALRSHSAPPRRGWGNAEDLVCFREAAASFVLFDDDDDVCCSETCKSKSKIEEDDIGKLERNGSRSKAAAKLAATHRCLSDGAKRLVFGIRGEAGCTIQKRCCYMASAARLDATNCILTPRRHRQKIHLLRRRDPRPPRYPDISPHRAHP